MSKLRDYLVRENLTLEEFGERIGRTGASVSRYVTGHRRPSWPTMNRIIRATNGEITANDFADGPDDDEDHPAPSALAAPAAA